MKGRIRNWHVCYICACVSFHVHKIIGMWFSFCHKKCSQCCIRQRMFFNLGGEWKCLLPVFYFVHIKSMQYVALNKQLHQHVLLDEEVLTVYVAVPLAWVIKTQLGVLYSKSCKLQMSLLLSQKAYSSHLFNEQFSFSQDKVIKTW